MIEKKLETGDLVLFREDNFYSKLKRNKLIGSYFSEPLLGDIDNSGIIIRTSGGVYVCFVKQRGKLEILSYCDFLADNKNYFIKLRYKDKVRESSDEDNKNLSLSFFKKLQS